MYCHILRVRAIPTLESTDSMMTSLTYGELELLICLHFPMAE